jgi:hypothetical protein
MIKKITQSFDIFGQPIQMYLNDNHHTKSNSGAFFSILFYIILITTAWFLGKDIVYKENPSSYQYTMQFTKFQNLQINRMNFPIAFQITDFAGSPMEDPKLVVIKFFIYTISYENPGPKAIMTITPIKLSYCKPSDFPQIDEAYFYKTAMNYWWCPDVKDFSIYGYWSDGAMQFLSSSLAYCDYDVTPDKCYSKQEIERYIKGICFIL